MKDYHGVLVKINAGYVYGWGEASPSGITGETKSSIIKTVKRMALRLKGKIPTLELISTIFDNRNPSASAALDMAIHDLVGKIQQKSVKDFYTIKNRPERSYIETSITIGIGDLQTTLEHAHALIEKGATTLKIKIGTNPDLDIQRVRAVRSQFPKVMIRLDGNQGYTEDQAIYVLRDLEPEGIQFIEQPIERQNLGTMARIRKKVKIPIMADEALTDFNSLENIIENAAADMINIKLMRVGGIREGIRIANRALEAGMGIMVGCKVETRVATTAGTHLALAKECIQYADLDGHLDLKEDFVIGGVQTYLGRNSIPNTPGLGLDVNEKTLSDYTTQDNDFWQKVLPLLPFSNLKL